MSNLTQKPLILWGVSVSPYVRKVMIALEEKGIAYEQREILPKCLLQATGQAVPADFDQASALGKIPALQISDFCIADSAVIAAYLDRKFPASPALYPQNPEGYARALWFEHYSDNVLTEVGYKKIFFECIIKPGILKLDANADVVTQAKTKELPVILDYLNQAVDRYDWIAGDEFSMADIAITTQFLALKMAGFEIDEKWPNLQNYLEKILARPSFQKILGK